MARTTLHQENRKGFSFTFGRNMVRAILAAITLVRNCKCKDSREDGLRHEQMVETGEYFTTATAAWTSLVIASALVPPWDGTSAR